MATPPFPTNDQKAQLPSRAGTGPGNWKPAWPRAVRLVHNKTSGFPGNIMIKDASCGPSGLRKEPPEELVLPLSSYPWVPQSTLLTHFPPHLPLERLRAVSGLSDLETLSHTFLDNICLHLEDLVWSFCWSALLMSVISRHARVKSSPLYLPQSKQQSLCSISSYYLHFSHINIWDKKHEYLVFISRPNNLHWCQILPERT